MNARQLNARLLAVTQIAQGLAAIVQDNTADEDSPHYDRSRTWVDAQDDYAYAGECLRKLKPTERAAQRRAQTISV